MKYFTIEMNTILNQEELKTALREFNQVLDNIFEGLFTIEVDTLQLEEQAPTLKERHFGMPEFLSPEARAKFSAEEVEQFDARNNAECRYVVTVKVNDEIDESPYGVSDFFYETGAFDSNEIDAYALFGVHEDTCIHESIIVQYDPELVALFDRHCIRADFTYKGVSIYPIYRHDIVGSATRSYWFGLSNQSNDSGQHSFDVRLLPNYEPQKEPKNVIKEAINNGVILSSRVAI